MSTIPLIYSAVSAVIVLIALIRLQIKLQPYKLEINNRIEMEGMITGAATLFWGVLFVSDNGFSVIVTFILIIVFIMNIRFVLFWLLCMTLTLIHRHEFFKSIFNVISIATWKRQFAIKSLLESEIGTSHESNHEEVATNVKIALDYKRNFKRSQES